MFTAIGCASPGPPRAPSLRLPQPVRDLTVSRVGDTVELHFTAPSQSTDKLPLRGGGVTGQFCRQLQKQPCISVASSKSSITISGANGARHLVTWIDALPPSLTEGSPRLLAYRVEFFSAEERSAGPSAPAFTAAGSAPAPIEDLHAEGSRLGVILAWNPSTEHGDVLLKREDLASLKPSRAKSSSRATSRRASSSKIPQAAKPDIVWLGTNASTGGDTMSDTMLDTTALPDVPYSYAAQRRLTVPLGDHTIEMRSSLSTPFIFTLHEIYPPPAPTGLTAVGFFAGAAPSPAAPSNPGTPQAFAVDLIWQPVDDTGLIAGLAGYNVYREVLARAGGPTSADEAAERRVRLNTATVPIPSFHDATANPATRYRYSVTSVDEKGNESRAVTVLLEPSAAQ